MQPARRILLTSLIMSLLSTPSPSTGADQTELQFNSSTIFRGFDRQAANGEKLTAAPAYEYLQLDCGSPDSPGLSLHMNGWERLNLADNYNHNNTSGELLHAYLQYEPLDQSYQLRVGRQYIFEGVAHDNIDGIYGKTFLIPALTISGYAGSPTTLDVSNGRKGDLIYGGKVSNSRLNLYDVGFSYKYIEDNSTRKEETLGTDLTLLFPWDISLMGHSVYNLVSKGWGEQSYNLRFALGPITLQPLLQHFRYEDFFTNNSPNPFEFLKGTGDALTATGTEAFWYPSEHEEFVLRFKNYDYEQRFKSSQLYSLLAIQKLKILSEVGVECSRMQGSEAENKYFLSRGYFYWNVTPGFITGDVMYVRYDEAIYTKSTSLFTSIGIGKKFFKDRLNVKLSFDYSSDPYFNEDFRSMLRVDYHLDKTVSSLPRKD